MRWLILVGLLASASAAPVPRPEKVKFENALASCVGVEQKPAVSHENLLLLPAVLQSRRLTAECGCKSAVLAYRVTEASGGTVSEGQLLDPGLSKPESPFLFVLRSDRRAQTSGVLTLHLGCGPP